MTTLAEPKETKARQNHQCSLCGYRIPKGDTYIKSTHVYDGEIYDWKTHTHCSDVAKDLKMYDHYDYGEGLTGEDFSENIKNEYWSIMLSKFSEEDRDKYSKEISEFKYVQFRHKLGAVIRYLKNKK